MSLVPSPPDGDLDAVSDAYRCTVMAVPHYEAEYDEPLETNMAAELSPDIANAVVDGAGALTPQLQQALITQSVAAAEQRDHLVELIDAEETALTTHEHRLTDLEATLARLESASFPTWSWDQLQAAFEEVREVQDRIDDLVARRQEEIRTTSIPSGVHWTDARKILYRSLDVSHPVLADATALLERATALEDDVMAGIIHQN